MDHGRHGEIPTASCGAPGGEATLGIIENAKELADLLKKVGDIDLYRRIVELEGEIIELTRAVRSKEDRIIELQAALKMAATLGFRPPFYFAEGDRTPYCANCWETRQLAVHAIYRGEAMAGHCYLCPSCKTEVFLSSAV